MNMFLGLIGCSQNDDKNRNNETEIDVITDFTKFSDMTREGTDKIDVTFDNHSGYPFYFTVQDQDDIAEIMEIIFTSSFEKKGKEMNDGNHTTMKIIQGEKEFNMHISTNKDGDYYYSFSSNILNDKVQELACEAGAYATE